MGILNVMVEQKCKCARASKSRGKRGWRSRQGVKTDWEKQRGSQPGAGTGGGEEERGEERKTVRERERGKGRGRGMGEEGGASVGGGASARGHLT